MTDLTSFVKHAQSVHGAIAGDLANFGGVLRCTVCSAETPVGDIGSHLGHGWPKCCGLTMTWMTLKLLAAEAWEPLPEGYELVEVESADWRIATGKWCRRRTGRQACRRPSAAELNRGMTLRAVAMRPPRRVDSWWPYCLDHMYGNWIENGQVWHWIMRKVLDGG